VSASGIHGDLTVQNANGAVGARNVTGAASLKTSFGKINVSDVGKTLNADCPNGSIVASNVGGQVTAAATFGSVVLSQISGGVDVSSRNGAVKVTAIKGGAKVTNSFGGVTVEEVGGAVDVSNQNGSISVSVAQHSGCRPVVVKSNFGPIKVALPEPANYDVSASTSFGAINSDFAISISGRISQDSIQGKIGNGGCELRINDSNGRIEIVKHH
jgi:DUF4097 and DUF4098 domain-containing protein YvlB